MRVVDFNIWHTTTHMIKSGSSESGGEGFIIFGTLT